MLKLLGFICGSTLIALLLWTLTEMPEVVRKTVDGEVTGNDLKQVLLHSEQQLQAGIRRVTETSADRPPATTRIQSAPPVTDNRIRQSPVTTTSTTLHLEPGPDTATAESVAIPTAAIPVAPLARSAPPPEAGTVAPTTAPTTSATMRRVSVFQAQASAPTTPATEPETLPPLPGATTTGLPEMKMAEMTAADTRNGRAAGWHAVWKDFRSELSARGFAEQLQRLTGREFRVAGQGPGSYQVQLGYRNAGDLQAVMSDIHEKTGLQLLDDGS